MKPKESDLDMGKPALRNNRTRISYKTPIGPKTQLILLVKPIEARERV
jgi:hypothetical protein